MDSWVGIPQILKNCPRKGTNILTGWGFLAAWIGSLTVPSCAHHQTAIRHLKLMVGAGCGVDSIVSLTLRTAVWTFMWTFRLRSTTYPSNELKKLVGAIGFEPTTPCAQGRCATRLRYAPTVNDLRDGSP
jgi:hypothetical protein